MKKTVLFLCFFPFFLLYAQPKELSLFTKSTCNNCRYAKFVLQKNGIAFNEFSLDEKSNSILMLKKLKEAGFTDKIYLPVIFENDTVLIHPTAIHTDSTLYFILEEIISQKALYQTKTGKEKELQSITKDEADCDFETAKQYLVSNNFENKDAAEKWKKALIEEGYPHADIIFYKNFYRVYLFLVFEHENEVDLLNQSQKKFHGAYLLKMED